MFQYSFLLKNISCFFYIIVYKTSSEKIEKLYELSLNLISHACLIVTHDVIFSFFSKVSKEKCRLDVSSTEETREQNMP